MMQPRLDLAIRPADDAPPNLGGRGRRFYAWPTPRSSDVHELRAKDRTEAERRAAAAFGQPPYLVLPDVSEEVR